MLVWPAIIVDQYIFYTNISNIPLFVLFLVSVKFWHNYITDSNKKHQYGMSEHVCNYWWYENMSSWIYSKKFHWSPMELCWASPLHTLYWQWKESTLLKQHRRFASSSPIQNKAKIKHTGQLLLYHTLGLYQLMVWVAFSIFALTGHESIYMVGF